MKRSIYTVIAVILALTACSLDSLVKVNDPEVGSVVDREYLESKEGLLGLFHTSLSNFQRSISLASRDVGIFTDELAAVPDEATAKLWTLIEARIENVEGSNGRGLYVDWYATLQRARNAAFQTRGLAKILNREELTFLYPAAYAIEGYSILMLAENFCSGIPLTTVSFEGKVEYTPAVATERMLEHAIALFDSALAIDHDSLRYNSLARTGKARAYLALGRYEDAALISEENDRFEIAYTFQKTPGSTSLLNHNVFWTGETHSSYTHYNESQIVNNDGVNGLVWYSFPDSVDPRVPVTTRVVAGKRQFTVPYVRSTKFSGDTRFPVVHSAHAKLIKAEYLLSKGDPAWLDILNEMRRGINLSDTVDPGNTEARVNLLFRERAYWLYLEGTRLSDMRRLVRQYQFNPLQVFPTGRYDRQREHYGLEFYGDAYTFLPDLDEFRYNHKYDGCINKNP